MTYIFGLFFWFLWNILTRSRWDKPCERTEPSPANGEAPKSRANFFTWLRDNLNRCLNARSLLYSLKASLRGRNSRFLRGPPRRLTLGAILEVSPRSQHENPGLIYAQDFINILWLILRFACDLHLRTLKDLRAEFSARTFWPNRNVFRNA